MISRELADDSSPAAAQVVGSGLARDIARKIDQAAFAGLSAPAPAGLSTLSGIQTYVAAAAFDNLDFAAVAVSKAEIVGASVTAFVTSPATALALATNKTAEGSNAPVLGTDATSATARQILGVPLLVSQYVSADTLWALDMSRVWLVVRDDATVEADRSVFFTSDRVAVKATMRAGFGFVHPASVVKVTTACADTLRAKVRDGCGVSHQGKGVQRRRCSRSGCVPGVTKRTQTGTRSKT
jgi:HK97 family phage major capsid protein